NTGAAEQHEVDAQDEAVEIQQEVLAPAADRADLAAAHALDVLADVARNLADHLAGELLRLLAQDDDGGAFGHTGNAIALPVNRLWERRKSRSFCRGSRRSHKWHQFLSRLPPLQQGVPVRTWRRCRLPGSAG